MLPKPPKVGSGQAGLDAFREQLKLYELSLSNRYRRGSYREDLATASKRYSTLARKREAGSEAARHFADLSALCDELLEAYGPEAPPKKRTPKPATTVRLTYPDFPEDHPYRLHFLEGPALRRQRAILLLEQAGFYSRQVSGTGRVLVSVGSRREDVRFYERMIETLGDGLFGDPAMSGFDVGFEKGSFIPEPDSPLDLIWKDHRTARGYHWTARAMGEHYRGADGRGLPEDLPDVRGNPPWDPDPKWQEILDATEAGRLEDAMELVSRVPGRDREILVDEVVYLRYLTGTRPIADDLRLPARRHAALSRISGRLADEFDAFLACLDAELRDDPPALETLPIFGRSYGDGMIPRPPHLSDWRAWRAHLARLTNSTRPRGRIFAVNPEVDLASIEKLVAGALALAEDAFRRDRDLPAIGASGWVSELALLDLIRTMWPGAVHQWRPFFLGRQSIDIHVPELNLAVEYQGQQHYQPVELFGGEEGFANTLARDERKRRILASKGVRLLEWRHDVAITREALVRALADLGIEAPAAPGAEAW
ncbi:hypothetical protein [Paracoccus sp. ME4]|uniref:hypothetical protein n=1 Tax=Paracoccus sp. ME4 TaxID=3138066 RepID=UPI00398B9FD9